MVAKQLAKFQRLAKGRPDEESWLGARWSQSKLKVEFGCKKCTILVQAGTLKLPSRYKDPEKSSCMMHFNVSHSM